MKLYLRSKHLHGVSANPTRRRVIGGIGIKILRNVELSLPLEIRAEEPKAHLERSYCIRLDVRQKLRS